MTDDAESIRIDSNVFKGLGVAETEGFEPSVEREVCLVNMAGRQLSPAAAAFSRAAQRYRWGAE